MDTMGATRTLERAKIVLPIPQSINSQFNGHNNHC